MVQIKLKHILGVFKKAPPSAAIAIGANAFHLAPLELLQLVAANIECNNSVSNMRQNHYNA